MKLNVKFTYLEQFYPTSKCRKLRQRVVDSTVSVEIIEVAENRLPTAFIVQDYTSIYKTAKYKSEDTVFKLHNTEVKTYNGKLYKVCYHSSGAAISTVPLPISAILDDITGTARCCNSYYTAADNNAEFTNKSVSVSSNYAERCLQIKLIANKYIYCNGKFYKECGEPMYNTHTFGCGNNYSVGFFIVYSYNENLSARCYFNALERDKALAFADSLRASFNEPIDKKINIIVRMPEMVKRYPMKEHCI